MNQLHLIQYAPVSTAAWFYMFAAWAFLYCGGVTAWLLLGVGPKEPRVVLGIQPIRKALIYVTLLAAIGVIDQIRVVSSRFGGVIQAIVFNAGEIYLERTANELSWLPYLGSVLYVACVLAAVYAIQTGSWRLASCPIILIVLTSLFSMSRGGLTVFGPFVLIPCLYTPRPVRTVVTKRTKVMAVAAAVLAIGVFFAVNSLRGLETDFPGRTDAIDSISAYMPDFPSIYSNFSAEPVAFSIYLDKSGSQTGEFFGRYTFAPAFRLAARLGFPTKVPTYEENYYTPVPMNIGTYLKNVYSDFGIGGIVLFPFFLGAICTTLHLNLQRSWDIRTLLILTHLYVYIIFSILTSFTVSGEWYISLISSVLLGTILRQKVNALVCETADKQVVPPPLIAT